MLGTGVELARNLFLADALLENEGMAELCHPMGCHGSFKLKWVRIHDVVMDASMRV